MIQFKNSNIRATANIDNVEMMTILRPDSIIFLLVLGHSSDVRMLLGDQRCTVDPRSALSVA